MTTACERIGSIFHDALCLMAPRKFIPRRSLIAIIAGISKPVINLLYRESYRQGRDNG